VTADLFTDHARRYSELEWALIRADGKKAKGIAWQKTQPEDPGLAAGKWAHWGDKWNIGVVFGPSRIAGLDVDIDAPRDPVEEMKKLLRSDELPRTPIVRTGSGRLLALFADPVGGQKVEDKEDGQGFELRRGPHMSLLPPSVHPETGRPYRWLIGHEPWTVALAPLPEVVLEHFSALTAETRSNGTAPPVGEIIQIGTIDETLASLAGSMARRGMSEQAIKAALVAELPRCEPGHTHTEKDCDRIAKSIVKTHLKNHGATSPPKVIPARESVGNQSVSSPPRLSLRNLSSYDVRRVHWLDKPFWQESAFHLLAGRKGSCKGTYLARHSARVTNGDLYGTPKRVLVITSEDSIELDFKPRVLAAGGDPDMVEIVVGPFQLPADVAWIKEQALKLGDVGLIILDPIGNHTGGRNTDQEGPMRDAIQDLNPLADELGCMVVGVRHLSKDTSRGALASVLGSTAFVDVPRCVILMAADDEDEFLFHAQVVAGNRGPRSSAGHAFRLELVDVPPAEEITLLAPVGASAKDVEDLLGVKASKSDASKTGRARELILDILDDEGEQESDEFDARVAKETGLAANTVRNVRSKLSNDGLIKPFPEKDEFGEIICWKVFRTAALR
jgi:hypothetical protein